MPLKEDRIWILLARKLSGEATQDEVKELEELIRQSDINHYPTEKIAEMWSASLNQQTDQESVDKLWDRIRRETRSNAVDRPRKINRLNKNFMIRSYVKTAFRGIARSKTFSLIN